MGKRNITVSIDDELVAYAKRHKLAQSAICNKAMQDAVNNHAKNAAAKNGSKNNDKASGEKPVKKDEGLARLEGILEEARALHNSQGDINASKKDSVQATL